MKFSKARFIKTLIWRVLIIALTYIVAIATGTPQKTAVLLTVILNVINFFLFYLYDEIWEQITNRRIEKKTREAIKEYKPACDQKCYKCNCV